MTIATKVGFNTSGMPRSLDPDLIHESVDASRERMGIDTIDLLYAHVDDPDTPQTESMAAFADVVDAGKVRHLGASNFPAWRLARANRIVEERGWPRFECVQLRFSYMIPDRDAGFGGQLPATDELTDYCEQADLTVLPYSPTLQGVYGNAVVFAWLLDRDQPTAPIIGCSTVEQPETNLAALDVSFTEAERERLNAIESYGFDERDLRG